MATDLRSTSADGYAAFDEYIEFQLGKTKSNLKWTEIGMACLWVAIALLGYLLLFAIFDQWVIPGGFGIVPRAIMLLLLVGGTGYAVVRHIVIPGAKRVHGLYAAKVVEQADPDLKSALLNYVDLQRSGRPVPQAVLKAIEKRTAVTLAKFDVDLAVDRRPLLRFSYILMAVIVAFGLYAILSPKDVMQSVRRALLPASPTPAPTMTVIANVTPGRTSVPARSPLVVEADIQGKIPESVNLIYTTADRNIVDEVIEMRKMEDGLPRYRGTLLGENGRGLLQNITYRIVAGDARTEDYEVAVIQPPSARVDTVSYVYPPYMELEPKTLSGGPIDAWDGTTVTVSATANMPVKTAYVALLDIEDAHAKGEEIVAKIVDGTKIQVQWKLEFRSDGTAPRFYMLRVKNEKGETDPDPTLYSLKVRPDLPPEVTLVSPTGDLTRPANATIPLVIQASDPDFKLRSLTLRGTYHQGAERFDTRLFEDKPLGQSFKNAHDLALEPLKLKTGDKVQFWIEARDNRQPTANSRSTPKIEVTITDPVPPEQAKEQHEKDKQEQQKQEQQKNNPEEQPENERPDEPPQDQKPQENPEQQPGDKTEQKQNGTEKGPPGEKPEGTPPDQNSEKGEPGDGNAPEPPDASGKDDEEVLKDLLERQRKKPRHDPPPRPSSTSEQEQNPDQKPSEPDQPQNNDQRSNDSKPGENSKTGSKGSQPTKPDKGTQDRRPQQDEQTPEPGELPKPEPMNGNDAKTGSPKTQPKPGEKTQPEQNPSEAPMPGKTPDKSDPSKGSEKTPSETQEPKPDPTEKPQPGQKENGTGPKPEQRPQPGSEKPEPQKGPNEKPNDPGQKPMPGEKGHDTETKPEQRPQPGSQKPEPPQTEKGSNEKSNDPAGQKPMPGEKRPQPSGQKPEKTAGEPEQGTDARPGEKTPAEPKPMDANPEDGMPSGTEKPREGTPMTGQEKPGPKNEPGEKPAGDETPPMGDKNKGQPGQSQKNEKPGENPQADPNPDGMGGTPTDTENPAGQDQKGEDAKPNAQAPKKGEDPGKATEPIRTGEEKPAEDSADARDEKATGREEGPAEGADTPDPNAVRAQKPIEKKPGEKGARQPGEEKPGEKTPMTDPTRKGNDPGASDSPEKAKPATTQKTKNEAPQNPEDVEQKPDPAKNPDRPREKRPGQPDAGNEELKGNGRKQGQKSEQPDGGEAGSSKTAEKGTQGSDERGPGDTDTEPGDAEKSEKPTGGKPSAQKGNGEQTAPSKTGSKPGEQGTGKKPSEGGQPSQSGKGEPGDPSDSSDSDTGNGARGKSDDRNTSRRPGREGGGPTERREGDPPEEFPETDDPGEANLRKNRDASNLVLRRLKDELARGEADQELLDQLGWSKENLEQFVERMEQKLNDTGDDNSPEALARRKRFEEFLRSLSVGEKTERRQAGTRATRLAPNIQSNTVVPPEYRDQVEAYTKSLAK